MRTPGSALALAIAACATACDRGAGPPPATFWIGDAGAARVLAVSGDGELIGDAAGAPAVDGPVRALLAAADGSVVALQDVRGGAPPAVLLSRSGERLAAFAAIDAVGASLFGAQGQPWAAAQAPGGEIWITGGPAPVRFAPDGTLAGLADALPYPTRGIAALPDGRLAVSYGLEGVALYDPGGGIVERLALAFGPTGAYHGVDALAARPDGTLLVAVLRHGLLDEGIVVAARREPGVLVAAADPEASARFTGWVPSALALAEGAVIVAPALGTLAPAACVERLSADLGTRAGCVLPGSQHGVAVMR